MIESFDLAKINETIVDMIDDHILVCSTEGQIVFSNKAMQSYLGYTDSELKQKSFFELIVDKNLKKLKSIIESVSEKPSEWEKVLFAGKEKIVKLHIKIFRKDNLVYIYGNEKYIKLEKMRQKLDIEISKAIKIHKRSLPKSIPDTENISFASLYIPAQKLGGDLFDAFKVDNGLLNDFFEQYVCFLADVSGHGLDSAMLAIYVKDTIRSYFRLKHNPGQLLSPKEIMQFFVEQYIKEGYPEEYLVCLVLLVFDLNTKELIYCNAGVHKYPLLIKDDGKIIGLNKVGLPISTALDTDLLNYEDHSLPLSSGMTLFLMSDGLPEQRVNDEFYEDRLKELLTKVYSMKPKKIIQKINEDFTDFIKHEKISDDITLVVVKLPDTHD